MTKTIWRVEWDIDGGKGPRTSTEFGQKDKAMTWAEGLLKAGGEGILVIELIVGHTVHFSSRPPLFQE